MQKRLIIIGLLVCLLNQFGALSYAQSAGNNDKELLLVGDIEARAQVFVFTKIPGKLQELRVEVGNFVQKGYVLAVVEHEELELGVRQAQSALEAAKTGLHQAAALSKISVLSKVAQAQAGFSAAQTTLDQAKALSFTQTKMQVAQAEAGVKAAKAIMRKAKKGARKQEKKQVEAGVEQAKAGLGNARSNHERTKKLFEQGAISQQMFEASKTQLDVAEAQYKAAKQQLDLVDEGAREEDIEAAEAQAKQAEAALEIAKKLEETKNWEKDIALAEANLNQAEALFKLAKASETAKTWENEITRASMIVKQAEVALELAQKRLADATITAPISGIVSMRNVDMGGMASPQAPIFQIVAIAIVKAKVSITESDLYRVKVGDKALISVDALQKPVEGKITLINPALDRMSRTTTLEIAIDNKEHLLKPGMFARARITLE